MSEHFTGRPHKRVGTLLIATVAIGATFSPLSRAGADSNKDTVVPYTTGFPITSTAPSNTGTRYGRVIRLQYSGGANGQLIATFESWPSNLGIYRSTDDGLTWSQIATPVETHSPAPWVFRVEPDLFELPVACGSLPAGTILLAANAENVGGNSHQLEIQYSTDHGQTWQFRGDVDNNLTQPGGMWEPNLAATSSGQLICYYSDERFQSQGYNQLLGERVSADGGLTWGSETYACAISDGVQRPGMAVVKKLPNGLYVMSFETVGQPGSQVHIKFSHDGVNWGTGPSDYGIPVRNAKGANLGGTPYIMWSPIGGPDGTLCLTGINLNNTQNTDREMLVNYNFGLGDWSELPCPVQWQGGGQALDGWSTGMIPTADGTGVIQLASSETSSSTCRMMVGRETLIRPGNTYAVTNQNSGLNVDIPSNTGTHGTLLWQYTANNNASQQWVFNDLGNNFWTVTNPGNKLAWDDQGWATAAGTPVDQWDLNSLAVQQWQLRAVGDGSWKLVNVNSNLELDVKNASTATQAGIVLNPDSGARDRNWIPKQIAVTTKTIPGGVHTLTPKCAPGSRLDDANGGTTNGNKVQIWQASTSANQQWNFSNVGGNSFNIAVDLGPYCLDGGAGKPAGTPVQIWSCNGGATEKWAAVPSGGGYQFLNSGSGLCLDDTNFGTVNGTAVQSYYCGGVDDTAQVWYTDFAPPVPSGVHTLTPQNAAGSRLDDSNGGTTNGNKIQIWQASTMPSQQWAFNNVGGSAYNIAVNLGPYCLDDNGGGSGTATHLWSCGGYANQIWTAMPAPGGGFQLVNSAWMCLDVAGGSNANGAVVQNYTCVMNDPSEVWAIN